MIKLSYIDTHTHLFVPKFDSDKAEAITRAIEAGVNKMLLPNIDMHTLESVLQLSNQFPENCFPMIGLHPSSVETDYKKQLTQLEENLPNHNWIAIGETGLDLYWRQDNLADQIDALSQQCYWARDLNIPIVLHTRSANRNTIDLIKKLSIPNLTGVFHCFSGTLSEAREMIDLGFYLGIGGTATYPKSNIVAILNEIGLERVVLETDSPYLPPVPHRGKRNESAFLSDIAIYLATHLKIEIQEIASITTQNANNLFKLNLKT